MWRRVLVAIFCGWLVGCTPSVIGGQREDGGTADGLTPEQASRVLATVGDRRITLGELARTLARMDQFDRIKYQSRERRRELLDEMIDAELLAGEARRLGLDREPETEDAVRMILRDALLAQAREGVRSPAELPDSEVRVYYENHIERFSEPERRRVSVIAISDKNTARKALGEAIKVTSAEEWGGLVRRYSQTGRATAASSTPVELAGDLGFVGPVDDPNGANPSVPPKLRAAVFALRAEGDVARDVIEDEGTQYIVRLSARIKARTRTFSESDRAIRVLLVQQEIAERERALEEDLRRQFPVQVDDNALGTVDISPGFDGGEGDLSPRARGGSVERASRDRLDGGR